MILCRESVACFCFGVLQSIPCGALAASVFEMTCDHIVGFQCFEAVNQ